MGTVKKKNRDSLMTVTLKIDPALYATIQTVALHTPREGVADGERREATTYEVVNKLLLIGLDRWRKTHRNMPPLQPEKLKSAQRMAKRLSW